jgi:hypothetical protein
LINIAEFSEEEIRTIIIRAMGSLIKPSEVNMKKKQKLIYDADFYRAMIFKRKISVWQKATIIDYGGTIEQYDDTKVKINDGYYLRDLCEFRIERR